MDDWRVSEARDRVAVDVYDPLGLGREAEPVEVSLRFGVARPAPEGILLLDDAGDAVASQIVASAAGGDGRLDFATLCFLADLPKETLSRRYHLYLAERSLPAAAGEGIRQLPPELGDGVRRLDTGAYLIELCRGTAAGHGGSKWGIRHFEHKRQGVNLIAGNRNALGGVYGPFFTPENGLVNPPAHMVIDVVPVVEGPVFCQYRMRGTIPDGLRPELQGKRLEIWWSFYYRSHWFVRSYFVDDYETTIDGRPCRNRITVGDEIESGKGKLLLSTYKHYQGTRYRAGDLYAEILLARINDLKQREPETVLAAMRKLGIDPGEDPTTWHWDNYWRLFCVIEGALPREVLSREVESIWRAANEIVWSDKDHTHMRFTQDFVDVNAAPQQTIFPLDARKTCEYGPESGFSFVRYVNRTVPRMQIVQRRESGWVNWGTNGENEYPELPSGSTIWSAYGRFADWEDEADKMETPLAVAVGPVERFSMS